MWSINHIKPLLFRSSILFFVNVRQYFSKLPNSDPKVISHVAGFRIVDDIVINSHFLAHNIIFEKNYEYMVIRYKNPIGIIEVYFINRSPQNQSKQSPRDHSLLINKGRFFSDLNRLVCNKFRLRSFIVSFNSLNSYAQL